MTETALCELCGEPMPAGEEMFKFHGYSGPCPKPPLARPAMSEAKHTPGPWSFRTDGVTGDNGIHADGTGIFAEAFADIRRAGEDARDEAHANARLIAAAPELLAALKKLTAEMVGIGGFGPEIRELVGNTNWAVLTQRVQEAHAAIAKAEGRS